MNAAHETQPDWGCVGLGTPGERGEKGPGGACMWLVPTRAPEIAHENLPHFIARNNTRHNKWEEGRGRMEVQGKYQCYTVLWMNSQRTGQYQEFQKKIRIKELASSRHFKKKSESKNWWLSWKNWWFSLSFFPVLWLLDLFSRAPSRGKYRKNIQFWGWGFSENGNHQLHIYIISLIIYKELMRPPRTNCPNTGKSHVDRLKLFEG